MFSARIATGSFKKSLFHHNESLILSFENPLIPPRFLKVFPKQNEALVVAKHWFMVSCNSQKTVRPENISFQFEKM